jgi:4-aminobutyrate aminotransferase-like enzyme
MITMTATSKPDYLALAEQYDADFNPTQPRIVIERGEGVMLTDSTGHQAIDVSDIIANVGHCHPRHVAALSQAATQMITGKGSVTNPQRATLVKRLVDLTPPNLGKVFLASSGGEVVEWAIRVARRASGHHEILSFWGGVYGRTIGAQSLNGLQRRKRRFGPLLPGVIHAPYAYCYRCPFDKHVNDCDFYCIKFLDRLLDAASTGDLAALIVEPYQGVGGIIFPPDGYLPGLQKWAKERGITFILDEIQSSFGRTGKMLALEWENLEPNMLCLGKGLGSGISIAALVAEPGLMAALQTGELSGGNGGNPFACASALIVLDIIEDENLNTHALEIGEYWLRRMREWQAEFKIIGDVRGRGACLAIEFVKDRATKEPLRGFVNRLSETCYPKGVALFGGDYILSLRPPLVITFEQAERVANVIEETLHELAGA